jgi:hypothetical protein
LIGGQRGRWEYDVGEDLGKMKIQNWSKMATDREAWNRMAKQTKTHKESLRQEKKM